MLHEKLTHKIIGCAMETHKRMGNGFQERIYQSAFAIEMNHAMIQFEREKEMGICYRGINIGKRRVDFFVEEKIMVEIKATSTLLPIHVAQAMNYLEASQTKIGLLINFGAPSLQFKRVHNNKLLR